MVASGLTRPGSAAPSWRATAVAATVLAVGTGWAVLAELQQAGHPDRPLSWLVGDFIGGWTFLLAGAIAWSRRRGSPIGPLLVAIGITWFVGTFNRSGIDWVAHLARSFQGFYEPLLGVLLLAYPAGRIVGRAERLVLGAWLVELAAWSVARLVLERPLSWYACPTCPGTVDAFVADRQLLDAAGPVSLALATALAGLVLLMAARRFVRAGPAGRRRLAPTVLVGATLLLGIVGSAGIRLLVVPRLFDDPIAAAAYHVLLMLSAVAVLAGLLQERLARTAVADLVIDLRRDAGAGDPDPGRLRDALARALGDPMLELFRWDRARGAFLDASGAIVEAPRPTARRAVTHIGTGDDRVAMISHDPSLLDDPGLVAAVTTAVRLESDNRDLAAEVERQLAELRQSRARIVTSADAERRRVERDLHDGAQQRLGALSMELGRLRDGAARGNPASEAALAKLAADLEAAIEELRELARGILPPILTDAGLPAAVESLALRAPLPVTATVDVPGRLPAAVESTLYFVIAEALANVGRHAAATRATIDIRIVGDQVRAEVEDDGSGGVAERRGGGIEGLRDRVGAMGGRLNVTSRPGGGTRLAVELPVGS